MSLRNVPGQERAKRFLRQIVITGQIPHALLFSGMKGIGKTAIANEFAKLSNCLSPQDHDSCDRCPSCRKIDIGSHPDMLWVESDGAYIKIGQIREFRERLRFPPFEARRRVIVIKDAQNLRDEAANALLKMLEEPPRQNTFVLLVVESQMLLPTIVSRCCHIRFQPLDDAWIEDHLVRTHRVPLARAREVARLAEGSLERAQWFVEEDRVAHWRSILANVGKLQELSMMDFFELMAQWAQKSEDLEQDLECIKLWVRDGILSRLLLDYRPVFEYDAYIRERARRVSVEVLFRLYDQIDEAMRRLKLNANRQLTLEGVCLAIKDDLYGKGGWDSLPKGR